MLLLSRRRRVAEVAREHQPKKVDDQLQVMPDLALDLSPAMPVFPHKVASHGLESANRSSITVGGHRAALSSDIEVDEEELTALV